MFGNVASWISLLFSMAIAAVVVGLLVWGGVWMFADVPCNKTEETQSRFSCWVADAKDRLEEEMDDLNRSVGLTTTTEPQS